MDWVHLHLALNHVPVLGTGFVLLALLVSAWRRNAEFVRLSLWATVLFSAASVAIKFTGDFAWDELRPYPQPYEAWRVGRHEDAADRATAGVFLCGLTAAVVLFIGRRKPAMPVWAWGTVAMVLALTFAQMAWTANLGGQLNHPRLRSDNSGGAPANSR